jgi:pimeloyl-ACP methyl ester carboxylesterase
VLLLYGERTVAVFRRISDRLAPLLPIAEKATIPGASHAMHSENPDAFNGTVMDFLASHS